MKSFVKNNFPIKFPKFIFTMQSSFLYNEFFKFYASEYVTNKNSKYIVAQHGSKYGSILSQKNTYEEKTSDKFLTWGWRYNKNNIDLGVTNTLGQPNLTITNIKKIIIVFESKPVPKIIMINLIIIWTDLIKLLNTWKISQKKHKIK